MPTPAGGTIADGIYDLVANRQYDPDYFAEYFDRSALRFFNGATQAEQFADGVDATASYFPHRSMTISLDATSLELDFTCPEGAYLGLSNGTRGYTVTDTELWLFQTGMIEIYALRR
jgi:hypothetical protein